MTEDPMMTCPVCDSEISEEKEECPVCEANLIPFKEEYEGEIDEDSMEKIIDIISDEDEELLEELDIDEDQDLNGDEDLEDDIEDELIDDIKDLGLSEEELLTEEEEKETISFECPACESEVSEDAEECPNCGVLFEDDSTEEIIDDEESENLLEMDEDLQDIGDLDEIELEEEDIQVEMEEEGSSVDLEKRIDSFQKDLEELKGFDIDMKEIEEDINKLEEEEEIELAEKIEAKLKNAREIGEKLRRSENYIDWLSERTDISKFEGRIEEVHKGCKIGEYRIARKKAEETEEDIKERAQSLGLKEGEILEEEIEEKKKKVEEEVSQISELDSDIKEMIDEKVEDAYMEKKDGDLYEAFHKIMEAKRDAKVVCDLEETLGEAESKIDRLKEKGRDHQEFTEKIEEAKEEAKEGDLSEAKESVEKTVDEIKKSLQEDKKIEEEEKKERSTEEEKEDLFKKIQEKIPQMRSLLETARDFDVEIEEGKDLINKAVMHTKENDYKKAVESLDECRDFFQKKLENKIDREIKTIEKNGREDIQRLIDDIKEYRRKDDYEKVSELIDEAKEKTVEEREARESVEEKISETRDMIDKGEKVGLNFPKAIHLLEQAKKKCEKGDTLGSREMIDKAQDKAFKRLKDILKEEIKEARDELKEAKIKGADISKPVELLKETNSAQKRGDLERSLDTFKEFKSEMEKIREKI